MARGEEHSLISFSKIGAFHLKAEPLAKKPDATKPCDSGRKRSQLSLLKMLCRRLLSFASEDPPEGTDLDLDLGNPTVGRQAGR